MSCGEVRKSTRSGKKIMKLYCIDGKRKLVHAGASGYGHNYSDAARNSFRARHKCSTAKPGTAKHLACTKLWAGKGGSKKIHQKVVHQKVEKANTRWQDTTDTEL